MTWWTAKYWVSDTLVDELIAGNMARPRPGMDKPDLAILTRGDRLEEGMDQVDRWRREWFQTSA